MMIQPTSANQPKTRKLRNGFLIVLSIFSMALSRSEKPILANQCNPDCRTGACQLCLAHADLAATGRFPQYSLPRGPTLER